MDPKNLVTTRPKALRCLPLHFNCVAGMRAEGGHLNNINLFNSRNLETELPQTLLISTVAVSDDQGDLESELFTLINLEALRGGEGEAVSRFVRSGITSPINAGEAGRNSGLLGKVSLDPGRLNGTGQQEPQIPVNTSQLGSTGPPRMLQNADQVLGIDSGASVRATRAPD